MSQITYRPKEDQNFWNMLFSVFFVFVFVILMLLLVRINGSLPRSIPFFDVVVLIFATFRVTRLIVYDKITRFVREWFVDTREVTKDGVVQIEITPPAEGIRGTIHDLLGCPWCIGIWSAVAVVFVYFAFAWAWYVLFILALAGAGSLLQLTSNMIGWKAENLKLDANDKLTF